MIQTGSNAQAALSARLFSFVYMTINNWLFVPQKFRQLADDMIEWGEDVADNREPHERFPRVGELSGIAKARRALFRRAARRGARDPGGDGILSWRIRLILACHNLPRFQR
jgi:hypothetical protein